MVTAWPNTMMMYLACWFCWQIWGLPCRYGSRRCLWRVDQCQLWQYCEGLPWQGIGMGVAKSVWQIYKHQEKPPIQAVKEEKKALGSYKINPVQETGSAAISELSIQSLDAIYQVLQNYPEMKLSNQGTPTISEAGTVGKRYPKNVPAYAVSLIQKGISATGLMRLKVWRHHRSVITRPRLVVRWTKKGTGSILSWDNWPVSNSEKVPRRWSFW